MIPLQGPSVGGANQGGMRPLQGPSPNQGGVRPLQGPSLETSARS